MVTKRIQIDSIAQIVTTSFEPDAAGRNGVREIVTLETPKRVTDTQKLRVLTVRDFGKSWAK